jgi:hypothetical protein
MKSLSSTMARCASGSLIALALAAAGSANAAPISFQFTNMESGVYAPGDTANSVTGSAFGMADDVGNTIPGSWLTSLTFDAALDTGTASGTWSFDDTATGNSLSGTFTALIASNSTGTITYTVTDGDGLFAGATGTGTSTATLSDAFDGFADFSEAGTFTVTTPVPEPSTTALMLAGLAAVGYSARRRKA